MVKWLNSSIFLALPILLLAGIASCEFKTHSYLIDIPTAYPSGSSFSLGLNMSITGGEDPNPNNSDAYFEIEAMDILTVGLSVLTRRLLSFELKCKIVNEDSRIPALAIGSIYLTPHKWVCPLGYGEEIGWADDQSYDFMRTPEQVSIFIVATKDMGPYGVYNLGIGNRAWVGYGPRSHLFNSDMFSGKYHSSAIGLFWGGEILLLPYLFAVFDFDGRDFNVGIKIRNEWFQVGIAAAKLEHRLKGADWLYPRFAVGASINSSVLRKWVEAPPGRLTVAVTDARTGDPKRATVSFPGSSTPSVQTDGKTGTNTVKLLPGTYWVRAGIPGYHWAEKKVHIASHMTTICYFEIYSLIP